MTSRDSEAILSIAEGGITTVTKVQKWGNSQGLRLSKRVLEDAHISIGDEVEVTARDGVIIVAATRRVRGRHSLQQLVSRIPEDYRATETQWGKPVAGEAW